MLFHLIPMTSEMRRTCRQPERGDFQPRIMVLDNDFNLMTCIAIASGTGVSHVHPTMAIASDTLAIGWSMRDGSVDHLAPQLTIK